MLREISLLGAGVPSLLLYFLAVAASLFGGRTTVAAWRSKPSWYAVSKLDQTIYRLTWNDFWQHA